MKVRLAVIGFLVLGLVVALLFYRLGGMKKPLLLQVVSPSYMMAGKTYQGKTYNNYPQFQAFQAQLNADQHLFEGDFVLIYDQNPNHESDSAITVFGGFVITDTTKLPDGYQVIQVAEKEVIRAEIVSHPLVVPNAIQIEEAIQTFAQERGLKLHEGFTETYIRQQNKLVTEVEVRP